MMKEDQGPYSSALDLPSVVEMLEQIRAGKLLTMLVARDQRKSLAQLELRVLDLCETIDRFYKLLGPRNWVFHERLNIPAISALLDLPAVEAERRLIESYKDREALRFMIMPLNHFPALRKRMHLVEQAEADYLNGRYDSAVLILLPVMDGFVQEFESARRGLHARSVDEMTAWDSVVGHLWGLANAHKTFTKTVSKTIEEEVLELYRNGILHGTVLHFNNDVVATKAWNRLFAVADWALSRERQLAPPKEKPSWREIFRMIDKTRQASKAMEEWRPSRIDEDQPGFTHHEVFQRSREYLAAWLAGNYGAMAALIPRSDETPGKRAGTVREMCEGFNLEHFTIRTLHLEAPAVCEVDVDLVLQGEGCPARMRWIREGFDGVPAAPNEPGDWRLYLWGPMAMLNRRV